MKMKRASKVGASYFIYVPAYTGYHGFLHVGHPNIAGTLENFICFLDHEEFFEILEIEINSFEMNWPQLSQSEMYLSIFTFLKSHSDLLQRSTFSI